MPSRTARRPLRNAAVVRGPAACAVVNGTNARSGLLRGFRPPATPRRLRSLRLVSALSTTPELGRLTLHHRFEPILVWFWQFGQEFWIPKSPCSPDHTSSGFVDSSTAAAHQSASHTLISGVRDRFPMPQPLCDQLGALPIITSVQDAHVRRIGAQVNTGRPRVDSGECPNEL
jgi:hypothetical protein